MAGIRLGTEDLVFKLGNSDCKVYLGDTLLYQPYSPSGQTPCFEVVDALSGASGEYVDVYNTSDSKWYKKNNLNEYEEYGIMPTVDALTGVTYYVGKLVILSTDSHEYKWNGSSWVDLGETSGAPGYNLYEELECTQDVTLQAGQGIDTGYHIGGNISKIWVKYYLKYRNNDFPIMQNGAYSLGSGTGINYFGSINYVGGNYYINGQDKFKNNAWSYSGNDYAELTYDRDAHTLTFNGDVKTFTSVPDDPSSNDYTLKIYNSVKGDKSIYKILQGEKLYGFKVWNNGTLACDLVPAYRQSDGKFGVYDLVRETFCECVGFQQFKGNTEIHSNPEDYQTKVAPPDNVVYSTLEELEMMECPWVGMHATVGGVDYIYTANGWEVEQVYTQYDYVQGNGTSYIDTGYYPKDNTVIELENSGRQAPTITSEDGASWPGGCATKNSSNRRIKSFGILYPGNGAQGKGGIRFDYRNNVDYHNNTDPKIIERAVIKMDSSGGYLDDTQIVTFSNGSSTLEPNYSPVCLFTCGIYMEASSSVTYDGGVYGGKIYSVKIYEGETLVRNFVPAEKDGVCGMYETITGTMYGSANSTPFTVGNE